MNEVITIENTEMQIREYNGQRVVTLKDIDIVHGKKSDTAKKSFQKHKKHFILGTDYFEMTRKEFGERYSPNEKVAGNPNLKTYLFTESGYLMIVKVFTDELAWNVQRQLVNAYFRVKEEQPLEQITDFPNCPKRIYQTSSTPVPKNPSWYHRNRRRMNHICEKANVPLSTLYHHILLRLGEEYDLEQANKIYEQEIGHAPKYALDIVSYFPDLGRLADDFLDRLERLLNK